MGVDPVNFYKRFVGDIQAKTGHLSLAEFGAYDRLLDHYYSTERGLPGDLDRCCGIARAMTKDDRKAVAFVLEEFFVLGNDGTYTQGRTEEMIAEAQPKIAAAKTNGAKGGRPKKNPDETHEKPTGLILETQPEPSAIPSQNQSQSNTEKPTADAVVKKKRGSTLPDGFQPNDAGITAAAGIDMATELEAFRNYHTAKGSVMADWQAAWRTWCGNARKFAKPAARTIPATESFAAQDQRLKRKAWEEMTGEKWPENESSAPVLRAIDTTKTVERIA